MRTLLAFLSFLLTSSPNNGVTIEISKEDLRLSVSSDTGGNYLSLFLFKDHIVKLRARIGEGLNTSNVQTCPTIGSCFLYDNGVRLRLLDDVDGGFRLVWLSTDLTVKLRDCYDLNSENTNWYGGPERENSQWPIETLVLDDFAYVVQETDWGAVIEAYWLSSKGSYMIVNRTVPLFVDQNSYRNDSLCLVAKVEDPYKNRTKVLLDYVVAAKNDAREAHLHAVNNFLGKPEGLPNLKMVERPIWSTWARYKKNISDDVVRKFAQEIVDQGFEDGQLEIDDFWETCYGSLTFNESTFGKITDTVAFLKEKGFRVTLWIHPFVNDDCERYVEIGKLNNFFVTSESGVALTSWWNGLSAYIIDFTNEEAQTWFVSRLQYLQRDVGIDSFKFDAGEAGFCPQIPVLTGDINVCPNKFTSDFIDTCSTFGDMIEVRVGWKSQKRPHFVRMLDKSSVWGLDNGLHAMVTSLLQMNMIGYTRVLPDMVGGNGYNTPPSAELFIRWLQANTFMPAIQFSYVPWDYKNTTFDIITLTKKFVDLRSQYSSKIIEAMKASSSLGHPVNPPIWWVDPTNRQAHAVNSEYLLGEDILVAPVLEEGVTSRDIFFPSGTWVDGNTGKEYEGNRTILSYYAPIEVLPYFIRKISRINTATRNRPITIDVV